MDFVHDQLATGRKLRTLTVFDTFSRFSSVIDARFSYRGEDVAATLDQACRKVGYPTTIRVDNVLCKEAVGGFGQQISIRQQALAQHAF